MVRVAVPVLVVAAVVALYWPVRDFQFLHWDDDIVLTGNPRVQGAGLAKLFDPRDAIAHKSESFLPLRDLSYALEYRAAGLSPRVYHVTNVALHVVNALLFWMILTMIFPGARLWCAAGVLFWALHPTGVETVAWVTGRKDLLAALFSELALLSLVAGAQGRLKAGWAVAAAELAFVAAILSKHSALGFAIFGAGMFFMPQLRGLARRRLAAGLLACTALAGAAFHQWVQGASGQTLHATGTLGGSLARHYLWITPLPWRYLELVVAPVSLNIRYAPQFFDAASGQAILALVSCGAVLTGLVVLWWKLPAARLGIGWFVALILPVSNLIPIPNFLADRYLYVPLLGVPLAIGGIAQSVSVASLDAPRRRVLAALAVLYLAALAALSVARLPVWHDDLHLFESAAGDEQRVPFMWSNLGLAQHHAGQEAEALASCERALRLDADDEPGLRCRVLALRGLQRFDELGPAVQDMLARAGDAPTGATLLTAAIVAGDAHRFALAEDLLARAERLRPDDPEIPFNLAVTYARAGDFARALDVLARARARWPDNGALEELEGRVRADAAGKM